MTDTLTSEEITARQRLRNIFEALWLESEKEVDSLTVLADNRQQVIATLIANLRRGSSVEDVLAWYESVGKNLAKVRALTPNTDPQEEGYVRARQELDAASCEADVAMERLKEAFPEPTPQEAEPVPWPAAYEALGMTHELSHTPAKGADEIVKRLRSDLMDEYDLNALGNAAADLIESLKKELALEKELRGTENVLAEGHIKRLKEQAMTDTLTTEEIETARRVLTRGDDLISEFANALCDAALRGVEPKQEDAVPSEGVCICDAGFGMNLSCPTHSPTPTPAKGEDSPVLEELNLLRQQLETGELDGGSLRIHSATGYDQQAQANVRAIVGDAARLIESLKEEKDGAVNAHNATLAYVTDLKAQVEKLRAAMPKLVDKTWGKAMMDHSVPSTKIVKELIAAALSQTEDARPMREQDELAEAVTEMLRRQGLGEIPARGVTNRILKLASPLIERALLEEMREMAQEKDSDQPSDDPMTTWCDEVVYFVEVFAKETRNLDLSGEG